MPADSDASLSREEFDRLVVDHLPGLLRLAIRLTGDPHEGEEIVQEAMVRASRSWQTIRQPARVSAWLTRIVINVFRDGLARRPAAAPLAKEPQDRGASDPASLAVAAETGQVVAKAVSALPPRQREALVLTFYEGLSVAEAAETLGVSRVNLRSNLHHARQRLRKRLGPYLKDAEP